MMFKCMPFRRACSRHIDYIDKRHCNLLTVPDEVLRHRSTLEDLLLDANQIRDLPRGLYRLAELRKLTFSDNEINRISPDIGNLVNLEELDASSNDIEEIPENMKFCKNLHAVNFSSNPISKLPEGFTQLRNLVRLSLNDICLNRLPSDFGSLSKLESLELRENLIKYLPSSLSLLVKLRILDLGCNLMEELPSTIGSLPSLEELWLDGNKITNLPMELGKLKLLTQLDLSDNKLEELPEGIGGLANLTDLLLSHNQLNQLPEAIGNLSNLTILKVDQNVLQTLTDSIGSCSSLQELILTENMLTVLPTSIGKLSNLTNLNVDRNRLTQMPLEIGECSQLGVLSVRDNRLTSIPNEIGSLRLLHVLDVSGNRLNHLPIALGSCNLKAIWMSKNQAKPMLNFQEEVNEETGETVLTCFLLPQQSCRSDSTEDLGLDNNNTCDDDWNDHGRASAVGFMDVNDVDADGEGGESHFVRQNTPHPKELRTRHSKQFRKESEGRVILHDQQNSKDNGNGAFYPTRDPDAFTDDSLEREAWKPSLLKKPPIFKIHPPVNMSNEEPLTSAPLAKSSADVTDEQLKVATVSEDDPEVTESLESPLVSDEGNEDLDDDNEELVVHHVGFVDAVDELPEKEGKLRRRDTPHHLKNKRINPGLAKADSEEKVRQILAQVAGSRSSEPDVLTESFVVGLNSPMEDIDGAREDVESGVCDDVLSASDDEAADEMTRLLPASSASASKESGTKSMCHNASSISTSNKARDAFQTRQEASSNMAETVVRVTRESGTGLGISIAGGLGSMPYKAGDKGIFISRVTDDGPSSRAGLRVGDKLISVNGKSLIGAEHQAAVAVLKEAENEVLMVIGRETKTQQNDRVTDWNSLETDISHVNAETIVTTLHRNQAGFGFSIAGGQGSVPYRGGLTSIYISRIVEGSIADRDGNLRVGDWIVSINGQNVTNSRHDEVVKMLTMGSSDITLVIYREIPKTANTVQSEATSPVSGSAPANIFVNLPGTSTKEIAKGNPPSVSQSGASSSNCCTASKCNMAPADCLISSGSDGKEVVSRTVEGVHSGSSNILDVSCSKVLSSSIDAVLSHQITSLNVEDPLLAESGISASSGSQSKTAECSVLPVTTSPVKGSCLKASSYSTPREFITSTSKAHQDAALSGSSACANSVPVSSLPPLPLATSPTAETLPSPTSPLSNNTSMCIPGLPFPVGTSSSSSSSSAAGLLKCDPHKKSSESANPTDLPGAVVELFDALERSNFTSVGSGSQINCSNVHRLETKDVPRQVVAAQNVNSLPEGARRNSGSCYPTETVVVVKAGGPLGLSIAGGSDHPSHPFGTGEPGIFISKIVFDGAAAKTSLRIGDRILSVNGKDIRNASHMEAVNRLTTQAFEILLEVRHDPQPPGLQEIKLYKELGERLGISVRGGAKSRGGNPLDKTDEGIFIARIEPNGAIARDGRLKVGQRILEVNRQSLLGVTHKEAVEALLGVTDKLVMLVCDGFDASVLHHPTSSEEPDGDELSQSPLDMSETSLTCGSSSSYHVSCTKPAVAAKSWKKFPPRKQIDSEFSSGQRTLSPALPSVGIETSTRSNVAFKDATVDCFVESENSASVVADLIQLSKFPAGHLLPIAPPLVSMQSDSFQHDKDLVEREIFAFEAKRKFFEKEIESASPSKTESSKNDEMSASERNLSVHQSEFELQLQSIISGNDVVSLTS